MVSLLFVCHGNICRSPMAEFIMKNLVRERGLEDSFHIESCATSREEIGHDISDGAREALRAHSVPFSPRSARRMTGADYDDFDLIIPMDRYNVHNMGSFIHGDPEHKVHLMMSYAGLDDDVADPWFTGDYERTYYDLDLACRGLLRTLVE